MGDVGLNVTQCLLYDSFMILYDQRNAIMSRFYSNGASQSFKMSTCEAKLAHLQHIWSM